ncbi:MAG TPA: HupE/UreJ family protein [Bryobacteraceae bacterium]|jgi:hydrogenase/urease accessory protein HupE
MKAFLWAALLCAASASAHEIGTSRVSVLFHDGKTYEIELATDANALIEKLEVSSGLPTGTRADQLAALLPGFDQKFRQRVQVAFDGAAVRPDVTYRVEPALDAASAPAAIIRFTGKVPASAKNFAWTFGWTFASYAMLVRNNPSDNPSTQWLEGDQTSAPFALASPPPGVTRLRTVMRYLKLGFTHIMPNGFDHILFVLGIYLLSGRARTVLMQVSAFTVAHSITLGLSMYGVLTVPSRIVEPMIAISIAYVAIENIFLSDLKPWRIALVFGFGLLHGLGFAGALKDLALPRSEFLTALVTFNVGVEAGQLSVIAAAFLLIGWHCRHRDWYRGRIVIPASAAIACLALYWTVQRIVA